MRTFLVSKYGFTKPSALLWVAVCEPNETLLKNGYGNEKEWSSKRCIRKREASKASFNLSDDFECD